MSVDRSSAASNAESDNIYINCTIKGITSVDNMINEFCNAENENNLTKLIQIIDSIDNINESTYNSIKEKILKQKQDYMYILKCIKNEIIIRPKKAELLSTLFSELSDLFGYKELEYFNSVRRRNQFKISKPVIIEKPIYGNVEKSIIEDNVSDFVTLSAAQDFNPQGMIKSSHKCHTFSNDNNYTYMQLMALYGSVKCFKYALTEGSFNENNIQKYAIAGGNNEIIHLLEQKGENFDNCFGIAIHFHRHEICDWLLNNYKCEKERLLTCLEDFNIRAFLFILKNNIDSGKDLINDMFIYSIKYGNLSLIKYFVEEYNVDANKAKYFDKEAFVVALEENSLEALKYLIEVCHVSFYRIRLCSEEGSNYIKSRMILYESCQKGDLATVKRLVEEEHFCVEQIFEMGSSLAYACEGSSLDVIKYLIEDCNINVKEENKIQYLSNACNNDCVDVVKYLVEKLNIDIEEEDCNGNTVLQIACLNGCINVIKFLINDMHADVETNDFDGKTALHYACKKGNMNVIKYLIEECHAEVGAKDDSGKTALHIACHKNNMNLVKYLINECHFDVETKDNNGKAALLTVCFYGNLDIIKYLVEECHASVETKDNKGESCLSNAAENGNIEVVKYLIDKSNVSPDTALYKAIKTENLEMVKYLVEKCHERLESINSYEASALRYSACNINILKYFIEECHLDIHQKDTQGRTVLHYAVLRGNVNVVKYLVEECHLSIDEKDNTGKSPFLLSACRRKHPEHRELFLYLQEKETINSL